MVERREQAHSAPGSNSCAVPEMVSVAVFFQSWPERPKSNESLSQSGVCIVLCPCRFLKWWALVLVSLTGSDLARFFQSSGMMVVWGDWFSDAVPICTFGFKGALWWLRHLPWDGTGTLLPVENQNLHAEENFFFFFATCGTCYQSITCWFFVHFSCGFSSVVAILLWSGLSTLGLSSELHVFVSRVSRDFTNAVVSSRANCHLLSASLDQYLE